MKLLVQSLFILVLAGISGTNVAAWCNSHIPLHSQADEMEVVVELEENAPENSGSSGDGFKTDGGESTVQLSIPSEAFFCLLPARTLSTGCAASIRQFKVNLLNSFRAPAFFILFHSFQGYLS